MKKKDVIKIESLLHKEISSSFVVNGKKYLIMTEDLDIREQLITTRVYLGGKILSTRHLDCRDIIKKPGYDKKISDLIHNQHKMLIEMMKEEGTKKTGTPSSYLDEVKILLQRKNNKAALTLLTHALKKFPDDPFLLSYYRCLEAIINKNYAYGVDACARAIEILNERIPFGQDIFLPTFYLNLGRAYLASVNKRDAVKAFQTGILYDAENRDVLWEVRKIGIRRSPVIPYLHRSSPINKYVGMILHAIKKASP